MMSTTGAQKRTLLSAAQRVWQLGGIRYFYRGLTVRHKNPCFVILQNLPWFQIGLVGVFP